MNPRLQAQYKYIAEFEGERNNRPSETVPSKSLSLRQIIDRDLSGLLTPSHNATPFFDDTIFIPDFKRMDLVDIDNWKAQMESERKDILETIKTEKNARKAKEDAERHAAKEQRLLEIQEVQKGQSNESSK